jgi:N-hydroxyarylamine O-acetyltransferase
MKDFSKMNRYQQTSPESHFTKSLICSMATPNGRITVSGNMLKITEGQAKEEREIRGRKELESILLRHFGIHWAIAGTNDPSNTRS